MPPSHKPFVELVTGDPDFDDPQDPADPHYRRGYDDGLHGRPQAEPRTLHYKAGWADGTWARQGQVHLPK